MEFVDEFRNRDKVRIKSGELAGKRGVVCADGQNITAESVPIALDDGSLTTQRASNLTNYSRAARLAWTSMPKRSGRPKAVNEKKMVSIRVDAEAWDRLGQIAQTGQIVSREALINEYIKSFLDDFD